MLAIFHFFIDLCLLRRAPQDLPPSREILALVVVAGMLGSMLLAMSAGERAMIGLLQGTLDIILLLAVLHVILRLQEKSARLVQTATALIAVDTLIGLIALLPLTLAVRADDQGNLIALAGLLFLVLVVWGVLVSAHILRHALEIRLIQGVFLAIAYDLLSFVIIGGLTQSLTQGVG